MQMLTLILTPPMQKALSYISYDTEEINVKIYVFFIERGSLTLKLHRGRNLAAMDFNGKSMVYLISITLSLILLLMRLNICCYRG